MMPVPRLELRCVSKTYRDNGQSTEVLHKIDLSAEAGTVTALVGRSGCGKTTLLNLAGAMDFPSEGEVLIDGRSTRALDEAELTALRRRRVGFVFQFFQLLPTLTALENVELPLRLAEVDRSERASRVREALERVRLTHRVGHRPTELSGGEQQRVAIARALVNRPQILLADEPTGNLDSATGEAILRLLRDLREQMGMTVVMVTHERPLAESFADRLATMGDGKLLDVTASPKGAEQ